MPIRPRCLLMGALAVAAAAAILLVIPTGAMLGPALVGGMVAAALYPRVPGQEQVDRLSLFIRCTWCYVVAAGAASVLLWVAHLFGAGAGGVSSVVVFFGACLVSAVLIGMVPSWAARQFRRLDFEARIPAAER